MNVFDMSEQLFFPAKGSCVRTAFPFAEKGSISGSVSHLASLDLDHCRKVLTPEYLSLCTYVILGGCCLRPPSAGRPAAASGKGAMGWWFTKNCSGISTRGWYATNGRAS